MTSESTPPRRWMAAITLVFLAHVLYLNGVAEDAFIALRFAKNLANGHGLLWNPGAPPVDVERVTEIRKAIETGAYPIIPTRIADAMIAAGFLLQASK